MSCGCSTNRAGSVREIEVHLLRAVARGLLEPIVEAENQSPGGGVVLLYDGCGKRYRITVEEI